MQEAEHTEAAGARAKEKLSMRDSADEGGDVLGAPGPALGFPSRHALREQDAVWSEFLASALRVVDSLAKSTSALCDGRLDLVPSVKRSEETSDRDEVRIEQECLRVLALFEPVASDLRRMATILKVNRDWERIADLAVRIAQRVRKLAKRPDGVPVPEGLKALAREVLAQVCASYEALASVDSRRARAVIDGDQQIDRQYACVRRELKDSLRQDAGHLDAWLMLLSTARNLERIADHATGIAQTVVYMQEGVIIRHKTAAPAADD
jgi:phosphate transport system protein